VHNYFPPKLKIFKKIIVKVVGDVDIVDKAEKKKSNHSLCLRIT